MGPVGSVLYAAGILIQLKLVDGLESRQLGWS